MQYAPPPPIPPPPPSFLPSHTHTFPAVYPGDDECEANQATCHDAGQSCYDHDTTRTGDWECRCTLPSIGTPATAGVATCVLDECSAQCPTCADVGKGHHACLEKGQLCTDPDTTPGSVGDWSCICPAPSTGTKVAGAAKCGMLFF